VDTPHLPARLICPSCHRRRGVLLAAEIAQAMYVWCEACGWIWKLAAAALTTH
jgi:hypothetical protein